MRRVQLCKMGKRQMKGRESVSLKRQRVADDEFNIIAMNSMKTCNSVTFYFMKNSFSDISRKCILPNMIRAVPP